MKPENMTVGELCRFCSDAATRAGWYDEQENIVGFLEKEMGPQAAKFVMNSFNGQRIALMHSELSEALEGIRKDKADDHLPHLSSVAVELADTLIRVFDFCGKNGIPLEEAIQQKLAYNAQRADHKKENRAAVGGKKF